jgi:hypothetical protein
MSCKVDPLIMYNSSTLKYACTCWLCLFTCCSDFNVTYKMKKACPGCCTAFGIHSGGIDKGVDDILEGLAACSNINWGIYKVRVTVCPVLQNCALTRQCWS